VAHLQPAHHPAPGESLPISAAPDDFAIFPQED